MGDGQGTQAILARSQLGRFESDIFHQSRGEYEAGFVLSFQRLRADKIPPPRPIMPV